MSGSGVGRPGYSDPATSTDRRSMSIGQLAVASPTQTASPVALFRAVPHDAGWNLQMPGQRDNKPLLIWS